MSQVCVNALINMLIPLIVRINNHNVFAFSGANLALIK